MAASWLYRRFSGRAACGLLVAFLTLPAPVTAALSAPAGVVTVTDGEVRLIRGDVLYSLSPGVDVQAEDVVVTGDDGYAQLEMTDGTMLNVDASSKVYLSQYQLRADNSVENATVSVLVGLLRFVAGKLRPESRYEFATNEVTIGIRGTEGVIEAGEDASRLLLEEGRVEIRGLDADGNPGVSRTMSSGQLMERRRGVPLRLEAVDLGRYRARLPRRLQQRPRRELAALRQRGVPARRLRDVNYDDVRRLMKANPHIRRNMDRRFERRMRDPDFRQRVERDRRARRDGGPSSSGRQTRARGARQAATPQRQRRDAGRSGRFNGGGAKAERGASKPKGTRTEANVRVRSPQGSSGNPRRNAGERNRAGEKSEGRTRGEPDAQSSRGRGAGRSNKRTANRGVSSRRRAVKARGR